MDDEANTQEQTVPVIEEELVTGTRRVKTGSVRVHKTVERVQKTVGVPTLHDVVEVTRKVVNQVVSTAPEVREEGDTLIVPVLEEEIVMTKRLVLKEEIHIRRSQTESHTSHDVSVGREVATVERLDADGNRVRTPLPATPVQPLPQTPDSDLRRKESLLQPGGVCEQNGESAAPLIPPDPSAARPRKSLLD